MLNSLFKNVATEWCVKWSDQEMLPQIFVNYSFKVNQMWNFCFYLNDELDRYLKIENLIILISIRKEKTEFLATIPTI